MCTAVSFKTKDHYFGRNLDLEYSYNETVTITPRNFPFVFRNVEALNRPFPVNRHYAIIGMAYVAQGYPLYYDAVNERGLGMSGLNFPENACWMPFAEGKDNISPFELIPWILGQCATVADATQMLERINPLNIPFSEQLPLTPLHWLIADAEQSVVVEFMADGLHIHKNPVGVMTNNPPFETQMFNLANYMHVTSGVPANTFAKGLTLDYYSRGMGGLGLPGDLSSASRFVKVAFTKMNSVCGDTEEESVTQFFHILGSVEQQRGCVNLGEGKYEYTIYSSCCNAAKGIYYYKTYENSRISAVEMQKENLDGNSLVSYPLLKGQDIRVQNGV